MEEPYKEAEKKNEESLATVFSPALGKIMTECIEK